MLQSGFGGFAVNGSSTVVATSTTTTSTDGGGSNEALNLAQQNQIALLTKADKPPAGQSYITDVALSTELTKKLDKLPAGQAYVSSVELTTELEKKANTPQPGSSYVTLPSTTTLTVQLANKASTAELNTVSTNLTAEIDKKLDKLPAGQTYVQTAALTTELGKKANTPPSGSSYVTLPSTTTVTLELAKKADTPPLGNAYATLPSDTTLAAELDKKLDTLPVGQTYVKSADLTTELQKKADLPPAGATYVTNTDLNTALAGLSLGGGGGEDALAASAASASAAAAKTSEVAAKTSEVAANTSAEAAADSAAEAKVYRDGDGGSILGAKQYMTAASTAASNAEFFKSRAEEHRDAAQEYRDGSTVGVIPLVKGAKQYMEEAKTYRDTASTHASTAFTHKETAKTKAAEALASANEAKNAADSIFDGLDNSSSLLSQLNANYINRSYWITSRDYDTSTWPENTTMLRWVHGQATDPFAVLMFVRLLDPAFEANNYVGATTQYVLPLTNPRVQVRYLVGQAGKDARYVRIQSPEVDFHIKSIKVRGRNAGFGAGFDVTRAFVTFSQNVINADAVLVDDNSAATDNGSSFGNRFIELDLETLTTVIEVELKGRYPYGETVYNGNMRVQFFNESRTKTFDSAEGPTAVPSLMDGNVLGLYGKLQFPTGNGIEVSFDDSWEIDMLNTNRSFVAPLLGSGAKNRRFFMRALFDPAPLTENGATTGFNETFFPPNEAGFRDFLL